MRDAARRGLAIGFFDGVHLGHQAILGRANAALTFRRHPLSVLAPDRAPRLLMSADERIEAIRNCGVGKVVALDFTPELAAMSADDFIANYMDDARREGVVYCGDNWRFGRGGAGDARLLESYGIKVEIVPYAVHRGERISSTRIRAALEAGDVADATAMLGRPWTVAGQVFKGKGAGAKLGFPTVNLRLDGVEIRLRRGVYAVEVCGRLGIANYGVAPTFGDRAWEGPVLEVHFVDGAPDLIPSDAMKVSILSFIRPETRFSSLEELQRQIAEDKASI